MKEFMGSGLVCFAFLLLRFVYPHPLEIYNRLGSTFRRLLIDGQRILYLGLLIAGLVLSFLSDTKVGLITFGCFVWIYKNSFIEPNTGYSFAPFYGMPILTNRIAGLVGLISLVLGQILLFITSLKYGFISIGVVFLAVQAVKYLTHIEWKFIERQVRKEPD
ncbi:MAG: hypothetical protein GY845_27165 [Planctomycetes bacterium]|nr:hypothetical protein [Planctomycetota bacterium]